MILNQTINTDVPIVRRTSELRLPFSWDLSEISSARDRSFSRYLPFIL